MDDDQANPLTSLQATQVAFIAAMLDDGILPPATADKAFAIMRTTIADDLERRGHAADAADVREWAERLADRVTKAASG